MYLINNFTDKEWIKYIKKTYNIKDVNIFLQTVKDLSKTKIVIGVDVGRTFGVAILASGKIKYTFCGTCKDDNFQGFTEDLQKIVDKYEPQVLISAYPTGRHNVIAFQSKCLGLAMFVAGYNDMRYIEINDIAAKKTVLNNAKAGKDEIINTFKAKTEHEADACMFAEFAIFKLAVEKTVKTKSKI